MTVTDLNKPATFELPPASPDAAPVERPASNGTALPGPLLVGNAIWFCRLRWVVVGIMTTFGVAGLFTKQMLAAGLRPPGNWPFAVAAILAVLDLGLLMHARLLRDPRRARRAGFNLWCQIALDLLVLTAVVHLVGSGQTLIAFVYLYHIVLACIFLSRPRSFLVVLLAILLYVACIAAERGGLLETRSIYANPDFGNHVGFSSAPAAVNLASAVAIWVVVWYLGSHLSALVHKREEELAATNVRLEHALRERRRHMLRTTHELKAPFAAIHAYTQVLSDGYAGRLPPEASRIVGRISARSRRLASEIQEMLQLANLTSVSQRPSGAAEIDLAETLRWCIEQAQPLAEVRRVTIESYLAPARTFCVADHVVTMLSNLIVNAINYSNEGGCVRLHCRCRNDGGAEVVIADDGIGIPAAKLPRIFEEHYRTNEAVRHNSESSGLGLAIVARVARLLGVGVTVESRTNGGTTFQLRFRPLDKYRTSPLPKETPNGIPADHR